MSRSWISVLYWCLCFCCLSFAQYVPPRQNSQANIPVVSGSYSSSAAQSDANRQQQASISGTFGSPGTGGQQPAVSGYNTVANNQRPTGQLQIANQQLFGPAGGLGSHMANGRIPTAGSQAAVFPFQVRTPGPSHRTSAPSVISVALRRGPASLWCEYSKFLLVGFAVLPAYRK